MKGSWYSEKIPFKTCGLNMCNGFLDINNERTKEKVHNLKKIWQVKIVNLLETVCYSYQPWAHIAPELHFKYCTSQHCTIFYCCWSHEHSPSVPCCYDRVLAWVGNFVSMEFYISKCCRVYCIFFSLCINFLENYKHHWSKIFLAGWHRWPDPLEHLWQHCFNFLQR